MSDELGKIWGPKPLRCECCNFETELLAPYKRPRMHVDPEGFTWLCDMCGNSPANGIAHSPSQFRNAEILTIRVICYAANWLWGELRQ